MSAGLARTAPRAAVPPPVEDDDLAPAEAGVPPRRLGLVLLVGGLVGFAAALTLAIERFRLAADPSYEPSCSLNPVLSCGSVMATEQASVLGFPNPLIGIGAFAVATTLGALLVSGVVLPRWIQVAFTVGAGAGFAFVCWLAFQSLYAIHALCPYCMVVWAVVIPMFWTTLVDTLARGRRDGGRAPGGVVAALVDYRVLLTVGTYAVFVALIGLEFWDYWSTLT